MENIDLVLKNNKLKSYDQFAILIFLLNGVAIGFFLYREYHTILQKISGFTSLLILLMTLFIFINIPSGKNKENAFLFSAAGTGLYWVLTGYWWAGVLAFLLFFLYKLSKRPLKVRFLPAKIIYPSFPERTIQWEELSNVILKDGLLTIDLRNNKIIQQLIEETGPPVNEKEFNEFCRQQLNK